VVILFVFEYAGLIEMWLYGRYVLRQSKREGVGGEVL
jgi:hypothetical protein